MTKQAEKNGSQHHRVRTVFAALFGFVALWLILASVVVVWLNQTVTDTNTYVSTVGPVADRPEVQDYFANKVGELISQNATVQDVAPLVLSAGQAAGKTPEQLQQAINSVVRESVQSTVRTPQFAKLWRDTNRTTHQQLMRQIESGNGSVELDLTPAFSSLLAQLKTTKLGPVIERLDIPVSTAKLKLEGKAIKDIHDAHQRLKQLTLALVILAVVFAGAATVTSTHHVKTVRRIAFGTGVGLLALAGSLQAVSLLKPSSGNPDQELAVVIGKTLVHGLWFSALIAGTVLTLLSVASKIVASKPGK